MSDVGMQLGLFGLDETMRRVAGEAATPAERKRLVRRVEVTHQMMAELPSADDLGFMHAGLAQTCLPHSRPEQNHAVWRRASGRFSLIVSPGILDETPFNSRNRQPTPEELQRMYVGVPYGTKARLIMIHLQTEGLRSPTVSLGKSLSAFLRSLQLCVTGTTIAAVREQCLRIARATFTMQWSGTDADGGERMLVSDTRIVSGLELWKAAGGGEGWSATVELSREFHEHLRQHAVPLDKRGIAHLAGNSLGLDLYAMLAYRLPRLSKETHVRWDSLQGQIGADYGSRKHLAAKVRGVMQDVLTAYPDAKLEVTPTGITMRPSPPAVPKTTVSGLRLLG